MNKDDSTYSFNCLALFRQAQSIETNNYTDNIRQLSVLGKASFTNCRDF